MAGTELRLLLRPKQIGGIQRRAHRFAAVPIDHADFCRAEPPCGIDNMAQHRLAGDGV